MPSEEINEIVEQIRQQPRLVIADDFEIAVQRQRSVGRKYSNGEGTHTSHSENLWISLRVLHRKRPGRAVTSTISRKALALLVDNALDSAKLSSADPWFRFPIWKAQKTAKTESQLTAYDSLHENIAGGWELFEESYENIYVETALRRRSERFGLSHARQIHRLNFSLLSRAADDLMWMREDRALGRPLHERLDWLSALARSSLRLRKARSTPQPARAKLLLSPAAAAALLESLGPYFHADAVQAGRNPLPVEAGGDLFASCLSLIDHGRFPDAPGAAPFDMEGSLTQETLLVDRGTLKSLLYDTYAATRENRLSTGSFLRSSNAFHPRIGVSNFFIKPGGEAPGRLIQAMGNGLMLESVDSLEKVSGEENAYTVSGKGWHVAEGQCTEPVKNIFFKFDIFQLFQKAAAVGNDLRFFGAHGSPSILFEEVPLSS